MRAAGGRLMVVAATAACGGTKAELPSLIDRIAPRQTQPIHDKRVALLPLRDDRIATESPDDSGRYVYRGQQFKGTNLDWLRPDPMAVMTRGFAEALLNEGVFSQVVLVLEPSQDPTADLVLSGAVQRARGYVAADATEEGRRILSEVVLTDLVLRDAATGEVRFRGATGWTRWELQSESTPVAPWEVLADTLAESVRPLARILARSDLDTFEVISQAELDVGSGDPLSASPKGWSVRTATTTSTPQGWTGEPRCRLTTYWQKQVLDFHRMLGPYVPTVRLWRCPQDVELHWDTRGELQARLLGTDLEEAWWFGAATGRSNWDRPLDQLGGALGLKRPSRRYIFELPLDPSSAPIERKVPLRRRLPPPTVPPSSP